MSLYQYSKDWNKNDVIIKKIMSSEMWYYAIQMQIEQHKKHSLKLIMVDRQNHRIHK